MIRNEEIIVALKQAAPINDGWEVVARRASDIKPEPIHWLWKGWLPKGMLTLFGGVAKTGKTTIALSIAAAITSNHVAFPDGSKSESVGNVLIWTGEDTPENTLVPRLLAAGANPQNVFFVESVKDKKGGTLPFDPARDIPLLDALVDKLGGVSFLIVDPIMSAVSGDSHKANDVRRNLQPIVDFARRHNCAVVGITHFRKGSAGTATVDRYLGSQAFIAVARMSWIAGKKEGEESRVFMRDNTNIAPSGGGFEYSMKQTILSGYDVEATYAVWGNPIDGTAMEVLAGIEGSESEASELKDAESFLRDLLVDCPLPAKKVYSEAYQAGYSKRTIDRAKRHAGIEVVRRGEIGKKGGGAWYWDISQKTESLRLPSSENPCDKKDVGNLNQNQYSCGGQDDSGGETALRLPDTVVGNVNQNGCLNHERNGGRTYESESLEVDSLAMPNATVTKPKKSWRGVI